MYIYIYSYNIHVYLFMKSQHCWCNSMLCDEQYMILWTQTRFLAQWRSISRRSCVRSSAMCQNRKDLFFLSNNAIIFQKCLIIKTCLIIETCLVILAYFCHPMILLSSHATFVTPCYFCHLMLLLNPKAYDKVNG